MSTAKTTDKDFKQIWSNITTNYSHWLSFILLMIVAVIINPSFLSVTNLTNQFVQGAIVGICAMGMSLVISAGMIDLSVGSSVALISGLGVSLLNKTHSITLCLLFCLGFGLLLGLINGIFITKGNIAPFIVTLATFSAYRSIITQLGQGGPFTVDKSMYDAFRYVASGKIFGIPHLMIIFILITLLTGFIMAKTKFGRYVYAVGSNQQASRPSARENVPKAKGRLGARSRLPGRFAPLAKAVIFPRSFVRMTRRLSYSPTGNALSTIPVILTNSLKPPPPDFFVEMQFYSYFSQHCRVLAGV